MRYVISDKDEFVIGDGCFHNELAAGFSGKVIAAGHCEIETGSIRVFGKSMSLNIESKPEDVERLERLMKKDGN
jgi:hypothetical protein